MENKLDNQHMRLEQSLVERLVCTVQKPGRYIGGELNAVTKEAASVRMGLCYPDLYEIGMSNNGIRILYHLANDMEDVSCERFFPVDLDFESVLRNENVPLYTLESYTPLCMLDAVGFNISHELLYTNMLQCLDLGKIPLLAKDRSEGDPIVIAGGGAVSNPMPVMGFADVVFIGDGEDGLIDILSCLKNAKERGLGRRERIDMLSGIEGVLLPGMYTVAFEDEKLLKLEGPVVSKRVFREKSPVDPVKPIVPNIRITQERVVVEATRGCKNFCKFCHAGYFDLPYRSTICSTLKDRVLEILGNTGYNEVTLSSLSISDYRDLGELVNSLLPSLTERGISISFPSLRVDVSSIPIIEEISDVRATSLTFAVESASERIRALANKRLRNEDLLELMKYFFSRGWRVIKLYFMIGLPGSREEDEADTTVALLREILSFSPRNGEINVTISPFVPKPHTPFQCEEQMGAEYCTDVIQRIKKSLPRKIKIKNHNVYASLLEGIISRGDTRVGEVILKSYQQGCRFDSWTEHFNFQIWEKNLNEVMPHWRALTRGFKDGVILPWAMVKTGYEPIAIKMKEMAPATARTEKNEIKGPDLDTEAFKQARYLFETRYRVAKTIRICFAKEGPGRFIPHLDFIEIVKRALRMAVVPVTFSQGYNKRERISSGFPVPLGIESRAELCDIDLYDEPDENMLSVLSKKLPSGIRPLSLSVVDSSQSIMAMTTVVEYRVIFMSERDEEQALVNAHNGISILKKKKGQEVPVLFEEAVHSYHQDGSGLILRLFMGSKESVRIDDLLGSLVPEASDVSCRFRIVKQCQYTQDKGELKLLD